MNSGNQLENLSRRSSIPLLLAAQIVKAIEESGASQVEALSALGMAQCLLPTLGLTPVNEDAGDDSAGP